MKKILSSLLFLFACCTLASAQWVVASQALETGDEVLSFAVISDTHVENNVGIGAAKKVPRALKCLSAKGNLDGLFVAGDLTNGGSLTQFQQFASIMSNKSNFVNPIPHKVFMLGNHDNYNSEGQSNYAKALASFNGGKSYPLDQYMVIKGFPFIVVSTRSSANTDAFTLSNGTNAYPDAVCKKVAGWLERAVKECPGKPIFVFTHVPPTNTMYSAWYGEGDPNYPNWSMRPLGAVLAKYPQVFIFAGHSHFPLGDPRSIHQGVDPNSSRNNYYTAIGTGSTTYSEVTYGMVDEGQAPPGSNEVTEGLIVSVTTAGDVVIRRYDTFRDKEIQPENPWVVKAPFDGSTFRYADTRDLADATAGQYLRTGLPGPLWQETDSVSVRVDAEKVAVTIPQAKETGDDMVFRYNVQVRNSGGRIVADKWPFSFYFLSSAMPDSVSTEFTTLEGGETYEVIVTAYDCFDNPSERKLVASFTTPDGGSAGCPTPDGRWTFDDPDNLTANAIEGSKLSMQRETVGTKSVTVNNKAPLTVIEGVTEGDGAVTVPKTTGLRINRGKTGDIGDFSLLYYVRVNQTNSYNALLQSNYSNTNDADFFIKGSAAVGLNNCGLGYGGEIKLGTWHRIVFVAKDSKASVYLDGVLVGQATSGSAFWEVGDYFHLFVDEDGEDAPIDVTEVAYWEYPLTARQVYEMSTTATEYLSTSTPSFNLVDDALEFTALISSSFKPVITLPDWIEPVDASPWLGVDVTYTYRCQPMDTVGTRTGEIVVAAPEGSELPPFTITVTQTNRGDVLNGMKIGEWTFDDIDNLVANKVENAPVALRTVLGNTSKGFAETTASAAGIKLQTGEGPEAKDCILLPKLAGFFLENHTGGALDCYSYMMDVKLTKADWVALFSSDYTNTEDADLFIKGAQGTVGLACGGLGYAGSIDVGKWYRIVVVMDYSNGKKDDVISIYVNGELVKRGTDNNSNYRLMDRWKVPEQGAFFFLDDNAETSDIYLSRLTLWNASLTDDQVASLGQP